MKLSHFLIIAALTLVILVVARNIIIRVGIEQGVRLITGLRLDIGEFDIGVVQPTLTIKDLKLYNPIGYADPLMADVDEIDLRYKPADLLTGKIYLKQLHFTLKEMFIVRQQGNSFNFDALKTFQHQNNGPPLPLIIDSFNLKVSKLIYKDYTHTPVPLTKEYNLNLDEHYSGIQGTNNLENLIMLSILSKTSIASSIQVNLNKLKESISGTLLNTLQVSGDSIKGLLNDF